MKKILVTILLINALFLASCSSSNNSYIDDIVGTWHTETKMWNEVVERQYVFYDDYTGEYTFFAIPSVPGPDGEEENGVFTWCYDENAKVYLIYIGSSTPQVARIYINNDTQEINISNYIGTKIK